MTDGNTKVQDRAPACDDTATVTAAAPAAPADVDAAAPGPAEQKHPTATPGSKKRGHEGWDGNEKVRSDVKRQRPPGRGRREPREGGTDSDGDDKEARRPKRKAACLIGYCGTGYYGMQMNPPFKTIEGDLFAALVGAGAISKDNSNDPKKTSFMRAARTDKGVHAAGNVISAKLIIEDADIVSKINALLPPTVRVWGVTQVTKRFDCRKHCGSRIYEYLIPSFSFLSPRPTSGFGKRLKEMDALYPGITRPDPEGEKFWADVYAKLEAAGIGKDDVYEDYMAMLREKTLLPKSESEEKPLLMPEEQWLKFKTIKEIEDETRRSYRISPERVDGIRKALKVFEGSHNFHNFTLKKRYEDPSSRRFMKDLSVSEPKLIDGTEWLSIKIHGQSFMLHQIRKMICMVTQVIRTGAPLTRISDAFGKTRISIPKAPALGLLLEQPVYESINDRLQSFGREGLSFEPYKAEMEAFKSTHIYDKIYAVEVKENTFHAFFNFIDSYKEGKSLDYFTAKGLSDGETGAGKEGATADPSEFEDDEDREELNEKVDNDANNEG
ncbi:tRNA pseudouridine synthase [Limtongia smithiae]|uniref:tRNA pseudouridine synthase n=1 Tax=Limtongia smithiae TaxID=1125753 RepID=UPI0034CE29AA